MLYSGFSRIFAFFLLYRNIGIFQSKFIGQCESTYELARHLSDTLIEQCSANEDEAQVERLDSLQSQFDGIRTKAQQKQTRLMETRLV